MTRVPSNVRAEPIELGFGLELACSFPSEDPDAIAVDLMFHGLRLGGETFSADAPKSCHCVNLGFARLELVVEVNMFTGDLEANFVLHAGRREHRHRLVRQFDPTVGMIFGRSGAYPPKVDHPKFGKSQACTFTILRFHVDDVPRKLCDVGSVVKKKMFSGYPPFVFNTVACVGEFTPGYPGPYTDPRSWWFNIFFGFYQLDCPKSQWDRPFGYEAPPKGIHSKVKVEDLVRLGMSDWNWFSNWNYGVPEQALDRVSDIPDPSNWKCTGLETVGSTQWHRTEIRKTKVASCYVSNAPGAAQLTDNTILDELWRRSFGSPNPVPSYKVSFIPTLVDAVVYTAYWEGDDDAYHTFLFGGTALTADSRKKAFLEAQLDATKKVVEDRYSDRGF